MNPSRQYVDHDNIEAIVEIVTAVETGLERHAIVGAIRAVAVNPNVRSRLRRTLQEIPDPLLCADPGMPQQAQRFLRALLDAGATAVRLPACQNCGMTRPIHHSLEDGRRVCGTCRRAAMAQTCGGCGKPRFCGNRLDGVQVCSTCYANDERNKSTCVSCGRSARKAVRVPNGVLCHRCAPSPLRTCFNCGHERPTGAYLQGRPFCKRCYLRTTVRIAVCPRCSHPRILAYFGTTDELLCCDCAGQPAKFTCRTCGTEADLVGRRCARCVISDRLTTLLTAPDGGIHSQLEPVREALLSRKNPATVLRWLTRGKATPILSSMAQGHTPISHEGVDTFPRDRSREYLRDLLIATGVLAPDARELRGLLAWLEDFLAQQPSSDRHTLQTYSRWNILRRARAQADKGQLTDNTVGNIRNHLRMLGEFLTWLNEHETTLDRARQAHIDDFISTHPDATRHLPQFLRWTHSTGRSRLLTSPTYRSQQTSPQNAGSEHWQAVERLLHDESIRADTRICALFVLLYGQRVANISRMTRDAVTVTAENVTVHFAAEPIVLPPGVDTLLRAHVQALSNDHEQRNRPWLFPGRNPARPIDHGGLAVRLKRVGVAPLAARTTAMMQLAAELPAAVLAGFLGIHPQTAVVWNRIAANSWNSYPALRRSQNARLDV